ncbi:MAG: FAD-binding protein, partial [Rubripirellula sp.]
MSAKSTIFNFGRNVAFTPSEFHEPETEDEVLEILRASKGRRIRVVGSLHAWSRAAAGDQVVISLRHLNEVRVTERDGESFVVAGGGCQIKRLLQEMIRQANVTLPSLGLITEQTIAGATATGTHGSGKHSLSHYVAEVRIANYDSDGNPQIETIKGGEELLAARCSLGCLGVILSVGLVSRPRYHIQEHWRWYDRIESVLDQESSEPLQQFFLIPWRWNYLAQHRHEVGQRRSRSAWLYRIYSFCVFDLTLHVCLVLLSRYMRSRRGVKAFLST